MAAFPGNVITTATDHLVGITVPGASPTAAYVFGRALNPTDPHGSIGVYPIGWDPEAHEIGQEPPSINKYELGVHVLTKYQNEEEGNQYHSEFAKKVRRFMYEDSDFLAALMDLQDDEDYPHVEKAIQRGITRQRFFTEPLPNGLYGSLSLTEWWLKTQSS